LFDEKKRFTSAKLEHVISHNCELFQPLEFKAGSVAAA